MVGATGAVLSIVTVNAEDATLTIRGRIHRFRRKAVSTVRESCRRVTPAPLLLATALPSSFALSKTVTVAFASATPANVNVLSLVM